MPLPDTDMTGSIRFRTNWRGQLILQVEMKGSREPLRPAIGSAWRDAQTRDIWRLRALHSRLDLPNPFGGMPPPPPAGED